MAFVKLQWIVKQPDNLLCIGEKLAKGWKTYSVQGEPNDLID